MRASRILETVLYAEDLVAAEDFYTRVLGLEPFAKVEDRHVFFRCGDSVFLIFNPWATSEDGADLPHGAFGGGHACFRMEHGEVEAWRAQLAAHSVPVEGERSWQPGAVSLYFRDPAGNCLELATSDTWGLE
jgi:catechol 2,3-dioxygenase-like lactoylglutathione lyase family enzyme